MVYSLLRAVGAYMNYYVYRSMSVYPNTYKVICSQDNKNAKYLLHAKYNVKFRIDGELRDKHLIPVSSKTAIKLHKLYGGI